MQHLDMSKIIGSRDRPWFTVAEVWIDREEARAFYHAEPMIEEEPGLGLADYWGVQYDCGLRIVFEYFHHPGNCGVVSADVFCPQHVERHLRHWKKSLRIFPDEMFQIDRETMFIRFQETMPEMLKHRDHQVMRQGDDGNPMPMGNPTTNRDAQCWVTELEKSIHKQIYWVTRCDNLTADRP